MNETPQDSTTGFEFEQRLLGELRLLVSDGALRRRDKKRRQARFTRRPALAILAALMLLIVIGGTVSIAAGRLPFFDSEKKTIANDLAHGRHIGPEVASAGPWKLFVTPSAHSGLIAWQLSSLEESSSGYFRASDPLAVSDVIGSGGGAIFGHVNSDLVATLRLEIGVERHVPLSASGYFMLLIEPREVSAIAQGDARLVALGEKGDVVKIFHVPKP